MNSTDAVKGFVTVNGTSVSKAVGLSCVRGRIAHGADRFVSGTGSEVEVAEL